MDRLNAPRPSPTPSEASSTSSVASGAASGQQPPGDAARSKGLSRAALAKHGGMVLGEAPAARGRPATTGFTRSPAARKRANALRPRSLQPRLGARPPLAQKNTERPGPLQGTQPLTANNLSQAKAAWLEAAKTFPLAKTLLQPQIVQGSLVLGEQNLVRDNIRVLSVPQHHEKWMVTEFDPRTESQAKRRRWALSDQGTFACCLEFLPYHERGLSEEQAQYERTRKLGPLEARARAEELESFEADVLQEVQTAALLNRDLEVHAFFRTEDNRLVAIMTDFPEEVFYLSQQMGPEHRAMMAYRLFAEVSGQLHMNLHRKGLVHGDLKPANIMMTAAGAYTLIDFEHTRALGGDGVVPKDVCEQATFAPPEFHQSGTMGKAGDLWALGYSMLHMFAHNDMTDKLGKMDERDPARPRAMQQHLKHMDAFDRALRTGSFEPVRAQLAAGGDLLAVLEILQRRLPYLTVLKPLATQVPEIYALVVSSLLARDPQLRADALAARALGQQLLSKHKEGIEANKAFEQQVLRASASAEMVEPALRGIAEEDGFGQAS